VKEEESASTEFSKILEERKVLKKQRILNNLFEKM
jgi:hypothetical protein